MADRLASLAGDWSGLVVVCATTPWDGHRLLDQHVAGRLAQLTPVLYVDPPMSIRSVLTGGARRGPRLGRIGPSLARLTHLVPPGHQRPVVKQASLALTRRAVRWAVAQLGSPDVRAVIVPSLNPLFGICGESMRVFYAKDDYLAGAALMHIAPSRLRRRMTRQPAEADLVVAVSPELADRYRRLGHRVLLVPNGCDAEYFATTDDSPLPADVHLPGRVAGFVGHLSDRVDVELLEAVAERGHSLLLVGPRDARSASRYRLDALLARPNVCWVGPKPYSELRSYLRSIDVGLVPYAATAFNQASCPLKTLEYLAAGRPVVSTVLPSVHWLGTELVSMADGPASFADAVSDLLARSPSPELAARARQFAAAHDWTPRVATLARALGIDARLPARS